MEEQLASALSDGDVRQIEQILKLNGTTISKFRSGDGSTLLHLAVLRGPASLIPQLIDLRIDLNVQRLEDGATALHLAAAAGRLAIVETLLERESIDDTLRDVQGRIPPEVATSKPVEAAFEYARNKFVENTMKVLHRIAQKGDVKRLLDIFQRNRARNLINVNDIDAGGETLLHRAAKGGYPDMVQVCLKLGCDPFAKNRKGKLPVEMTKNETVRRMLKSAPMVESPELHSDLAHRTDGYLLKYVNFASGYKRRYVVLEDGILSYYKSKEDYPVSCKGSVNVQFARLVMPPGDKLSFELRTPKYCMYFRADNQADAGKWILALGRWQSSLESQGEKSANALNLGHPVISKSSQSSMAIDVDNEFQLQLRSIHAKTENLASALRALPSLRPLTNEIQDGEDANQSRVVNTSVCLELVQDIQDFLNLCDEREEYWQERVKAEIIRRSMIEEALTKGDRQVSKNRYSGGVLADTGSSTVGDEFYDAMDQGAESMAALSISTSGSELISSESLVCIGKPIPRTPSVEKLEELRIAERAVPAADITFIEDDLKGYSELRRTRVPLGSDSIPPISIWNIIKNAIGKDLTRIPIPVNFSEPISMLQRFCEDLEYADLLYLASIAEDPLMRLQYVAAFAISPYSSTDGRVSKPFNPLLGETFEYVSHEHGFRYVSEQVSHHPPISACYCESARFIYFAEVLVKTKFLKSLELVPEGLNHVVLKNTNEHFSYRKVSTAVYNLIMGKMWLDHYGTMKLTNHTNGDHVELEFKATGWRTTDPRRLEGTVFDATGTPRYKLEGYWHRYMQSTNLATGEVKELWRRRAVPPWSPSTYNFTYLTMTLNEITPELQRFLPPTDCRLRPDQRAMEEGKFEEANDIKIKLEELQRARRKTMESMGTEWTPRWFTHDQCEPHTGEPYWRYLGGYWETRKTQSNPETEKQSWDEVVEIYQVESEPSTESLSEPTITKVTAVSATSSCMTILESQSGSQSDDDVGQ